MKNNGRKTKKNRSQITVYDGATTKRPDEYRVTKEKKEESMQSEKNIEMESGKEE